MGVSIALKSAQKSAQGGRGVLLIERKHLGAGSSGRSGAILRQHYRDAEVAAMARDSLREYAGFEAATGLPLGFRRTGVLTLAGPAQPEWLQRIRENVVMLLGLGIDTELVDAARMRAARAGRVVHDSSVWRVEPGGGFVDPNRTLTCSRRARDLGADLRTGVELLELRVANGRVSGARTSAGEVEAEQVVVVAGPWTRALFARMGLDFPLKVVRPENHWLGVPEMEAEPTVRGARGVHPVLIDLELGCYARCEPANARTRVGRVDYDDDRVVADPDALDEVVSDELVRWSRATLARRIRPTPAVPTRARRPRGTLTPDAQALIGPVSGVAGLFIVSGFSGHGFKLGPSVGEGVAQMLFGERVTALDRVLRPDPLQGGESWAGGSVCSGAPGELGGELFARVHAVQDAVEQAVVDRPAAREVGARAEDRVSPLISGIAAGDDDQGVR
jgi:glycine/D-amino acid oxidase-like deaminating enzyme